MDIQPNDTKASILSCLPLVEARPLEGRQRSASWSYYQLKKADDSKRYASQEDVSTPTTSQPIPHKVEIVHPSKVGALKTDKPAKKAKPIDINPDEVSRRCQAVTIDGERILPPEEGSQLIPYMEKMASGLKYSETHTTATFKYGESETVILNLKTIGRGANATVYEVINESGEKSTRVLKRTHPTMKSMDSVEKDIAQSKFWLEERQPKYFTIPKYIYCDSAGAFRICEKSNGETLTKLLICMGIFSIDWKDSSNPVASLNIERLDDEGVMKTLQPLADGITEMLEIMREYPDHCTSLSTHNIHITCSWLPSGEVESIDKVELVDIGINRNKAERYKALTTLHDYLVHMDEIGCLQKHLTDKRFKSELGSLKEWQDAAPYRPQSMNQPLRPVGRVQSPLPRSMDSGERVPESLPDLG